MSRLTYSGISDQKRAVFGRLEDARVLLDASRGRGAMYLAGYAVECTLKHRLMLIHGCRNLMELQSALEQRGHSPAEADPFTHGLHRLLWLTGGIARVRADLSAWRAFTTVNEWMPAWRYAADAPDDAQARGFLRSVESTIHWIDANL